MSLINDALKKAQKQRTGESPPLYSMPSVGGDSPHRIARRAKPAGFNTLIVRAGIAGGVALVLGIGGYFAFREKPKSGGPAPVRQSPGDGGSPSAASSDGGSPPAGGPSASPPQPTTNAQPPASSAPVFTLKTESVAKVETPAPTSAPVPAKTEAPKASDQNAPVSGLKSQVSAAQPPKPAPKVEPRAIEFIENLKVAGIRASPTDAKVLMNDRVYRLDSLVSAEFGLKLVGITANSLTFEDDHGGRYTRTF